LGERQKPERGRQKKEERMVGSILGRNPIHPAVFVRVANKGLRAYGT
jgi:hypothetical protein